MAEDEKKGLLEKLMENEKYRRIVILAGIAGIALIFLSGLFQPSEKKQSPPVETATSAQTYAHELEASLTGLVEEIKGAGSARVLVTLDRGAERVYATQGKKSRQTDGGNTASEEAETSYLLVKDADGSQKALEVTERQPVIKGVVVVCDGGDDIAVQQNIINAVTTALDISSARVCVVKAK